MIDMESDEYAEPLKRTGHVAVKHGKFMLVWGGYMDVNGFDSRYQATDEIWLYDRLVEKWTYLKTSKENSPMGTSASCGLVHEDKLYIFGGFRHTNTTPDDRSYSNEMFCLDLMKLTWHNYTCEGQRPIACDKMVGWLHNDKLYYFGGFGHPPKTNWSHGLNKTQCQFCYDVSLDGMVGGRGWNNQLVVFDPRSQKWKWPSFKGPPPIPRAAHAGAKVGNKVYIFGGRNQDVRMNDLHCLDLDTMTWSDGLETKGSVPDGRSWHSLIAVSNTHLALYGGFSQNNKAFSDCWLLNLETMCWTSVPIEFPKPRLWHTACLGDPGEVLIFGGCTGNILSPRIPSQSEDVFTLWFAPKSLLRLCLDAIILQNNELELWSQLPQSLQNILYLKSSDTNILLADNR